MTLKDSKWLSHAQDLFDKSLQNGDKITDNMIKSVYIDDINAAGVYADDTIDTDNHALYGPTNKANLAPLYYPNLIYNSTFSNNNDGWSISGTTTNGYSSTGFNLIRIVPNTSIDQDESSLPSYQGTYHAWYNYWFNHKYGSVSPKFAFRVGIKYTSSDTGFKSGSNWSNYGFGDSFFIFKDADSNWVDSENFAISADPTVTAAYAIESSLLYTDKSNTIKGKTFSDPTKQVPFDEFYTPWGVIQPDKAFNRIGFYFPNTVDNTTVSGAFDIFDPQLILVNNNMTREQLNKLDIRVLPTYGNDSVGFNPKGYTFN